jgi:hypothetical protein
MENTKVLLIERVKNSNISITLKEIIIEEITKAEQETEFIYEDIRCLIIFTDLGTFNGFVFIDETHPLYEKTYDDLNENYTCKTELTFGENGKYGFDTNFMIVPYFLSFIDYKTTKYTTFNDTAEKVKKIAHFFKKNENYY